MACAMRPGLSRLPSKSAFAQIAAQSRRWQHSLSQQGHKLTAYDSRPGSISEIIAIPILGSRCASFLCAWRYAWLGHFSFAVFQYGGGWLGAQGKQDFNASHQAELVPRLEALPIVSASAGWGHGAATDADGHLYVWGRPHDYRNVVRWIRSQQQSGFMLRSWQWTLQNVLKTDLRAHHVPPPDSAPHTRFTSVSCSPGALTAALDASGQIWCMGSNTHGQCGSGASSINEYDPVPVLGMDQPATQVSCGFQFVLALTADGRMWGWGKGGRGQLGLVDNDTYKAPVPLDGPGGSLVGVPFVQVEAGFSHGAGLTADGHVYVWGRMRSPDTHTERSERFQRDAWAPVRVHMQGRAVKIACGQAHTTILGEDGSVWMLGMRGRGLMFDNTARPAFLDATGTVVSGGGAGHSSSGAGVGTRGAAHGGTNDSSSAPSVLPQHSSAAGVHDVALSNDPRFVPETDIVVHPQQMPPMPWQDGGLRLDAGRNVVSLAAGLHHSYAVLASGQVWRWGWRGVPELVQPISEAGVRAESLACGFCHTLVIGQQDPASTGALGADGSAPAGAEPQDWDTASATDSDASAEPTERNNEAFFTT